uniref:Peptidase A1 domain-containing protein n=1 Tax=Chaetoceros debilis TaxID=122233 RepID=A0A7S3VAK6_9STRA
MNSLIAFFFLSQSFLLSISLFLFQFHLAAAQSLRKAKYEYQSTPTVTLALADADADADATDEILEPPAQVQVAVPKTSLSVPLFQSHNSYHVNMYIGSPPQRRLVIVDTGSRYLVFPCKPCRNCGKQHFSNDYFDPNISSTDVSNQCVNTSGSGSSSWIYNVRTGINTNTETDVDTNINIDIQQCTFQTSSRQQEVCDPRTGMCQFRQNYAEGSSISGYEMEDIVWFGTDNEEESMKIHMQYAVPLSFGCQTVETGMIARQFADGIIGLVEHDGNAVLDMMHDAGVIDHRAFSLCLSKKGGFLSLGGTALLNDDENENVAAAAAGTRHRHLETMQMEPLLKGSKYYAVQVEAVFLGELEIATKAEVANAFHSNKKGAVIDSGSTDSYLPKDLRDHFASAWMNHHKSVNNSGGGNTDLHQTYTNKMESYTREAFQKLPNLTIVLKSGYKWVIEPFSYMEEVRSNGSKVESSSASASDPINYTSDWPAGTETAPLLFINRLYWDEPSGGVFGSNAMVNHDILFDLENGTIGFAKANCN